jgi:COMPASS component SWD3
MRAGHLDLTTRWCGWACGGSSVLRVYDRFCITDHPQLRLGSLQLVHAINGTRTKNWPIKSSLFQGHDYQQAVRRRWPKQNDGHPTSGDYRPRSPELISFQDPTVHDALLLATGSADNYAYIFDVSGPSVSLSPLAN